MFDCFISHDWRESDERLEVIRYLDKVYGLDWRNFGNIWYDPRIKISSRDGENYLKSEMIMQIVPSEIVMLIPSFEIKNNRHSFWRNFIIDIAKKNRKPIFDFGVMFDLNKDFRKSFQEPDTENFKIFINNFIKSPKPVDSNIDNV